MASSNFSIDAKRDLNNVLKDDQEKDSVNVYEFDPSASPQHSPITPSSATRPHSASTAVLPTVDEEESSTTPTAAPGPRPRSSRASANLNEHGKRKRSRVTPEQLVHLERIFAQDRSPTAAKRKEISELLGMQERQTQIWFQNR